MPDRRIMGDIVTKLLRAASNGERLHLDAEHARALISSRVFPLLTELQAEELQQIWAEEPPKESRSSPPKARNGTSKSASTGSGPVSNAQTGVSAGMRVAESVVSQRASAAVESVIRQARQKRRLQRMLPSQPSRSDHSHPPKLASGSS